MTLHRQLLLFTLVLCFFLFIGVWAYKLQSTRAFLELQLEAHAQDTATSLALSMSPLVAVDDIAAVETMMNAIFDGGYYKVITFSDVHGEIVSNRQSLLTIDKVPDWFIDILPLSPPGGESLVMAGWKRAGTVYVESHPGYAYVTLWNTFVKVLIYFLLTGLIVFVIGDIALRVILKPLRKVAQQAEAICRKEYEIQQQIPWTRELKSVVTSMNTMTSRVREMFEEQTLIAEKLRSSAFGDQLTGLSNRRFMENQVDTVMGDSPEIAKGLFLIIHIRQLNEINESKGYSAGDQLLQRCAEVISETLTPYSGHTISRLGGGDFGVFLPDADKLESEQISSLLSEKLAGLSVEDLGVSNDISSIGGVYYNTPCSFNHLLAKTDTALIGSRHKGPNSWKLEPAYCEDDAPTQGRVWWKKTLEQSLADRAINLYGQRVTTSADPGEDLHQEIFSRITIDIENEVAAGVFIPLAEQAEVIVELDRKVMELIFSSSALWTGLPLAVNLSITSLQNPDFTDWVVSRLRSDTGRMPKFTFEFPEFNVIKQLDLVKEFGSQIKELGHSIGIDDFGRSFGNFGYLKSLQPSYVKIDASFTRELDSDQSDGFFFIGALNSVAHSLDIKVIAKGVETSQQLALFMELKIDGYQGYLIEEPRLLTSKV